MHKVHKYLEYHSVCPAVGIGTPHPLSRIVCMACYILYVADCHVAVQAVKCFTGMPKMTKRISGVTQKCPDALRKYQLGSDILLTSSYVQYMTNPIYILGFDRLKYRRTVSLASIKKAYCAEIFEQSMGAIGTE